MKVKNPVSQNNRIFPKINQKKDLQNRKVQVLKSMFIYALNALGVPLTQTPASVRWAWKRSSCGTAEALLSLQLVWIVRDTVSHLSLENIP